MLRENGYKLEKHSKMLMDDTKYLSKMLMMEKNRAIRDWRERGWNSYFAFVYGDVSLKNRSHTYFKESIRFSFKENLIFMVLFHYEY